MSDPTQHESDQAPSKGSVSKVAIEWIEQFLKHFQLNFIDKSSSIPLDAEQSALHLTTIRVLFDTLKDSDSRLDDEYLIELIGQILSERNTDSRNWSDEKNARRFALIDKDIQDGLTVKEQFELARLTHQMRLCVDTESNLPMKGAKALHKKLMEMDAADQ